LTNTDYNFFNIPSECLVEAEAPALGSIADCEALHPALAFCECGEDGLPDLGSAEIVR